MTLPTSADLQGLDLLLRLGRVRDAIVRARPDTASVVDVLHGSALMLALPPPRDGQHVVVAPSRTGKVVVWLVVSPTTTTTWPSTTDSRALAAAALALHDAAGGHFAE